MKFKKIMIIMLSVLIIFIFTNCNKPEDTPEIYNTECDFVFYITCDYYYITEDRNGTSYYLDCDITNKTEKGIKEIRDLEIEINFGNDIICTIWAKDIEFNTPLKPNETLNKEIETYNIGVGLGTNNIEEKKEQMKNKPIESISYNYQTYNLIYALT